MSVKNIIGMLKMSSMARNWGMWWWWSELAACMPQLAGAGAGCRYTCGGYVAKTKAPAVALAEVGLKPTRGAGGSVGFLSSGKLLRSCAE